MCLLFSFTWFTVCGCIVVIDIDLFVNCVADCYLLVFIVRFSYLFRLFAIRLDYLLF